MPLSVKMIAVLAPELPFLSTPEIQILIFCWSGTKGKKVWMTEWNEGRQYLCLNLTIFEISAMMSLLILVEAVVLEYVYCLKHVFGNPVLFRMLLFYFSCLYCLVRVSSDNLTLFIPNSLLSVCLSALSLTLHFFA